MAIIEKILLNALQADALGTVFEGHTKGHIKSDLYEENGIPLMKLNNKELQKWRKPLLYSSMSQLMILSAMHVDKKGNLLKLKKVFKEIEHIAEPGIMRYCDSGELNFIKGTPENIMSARLLSQSLALSILIDLYRFNIEQCLLFCFQISTSPVVIHGIMILGHIIARASQEEVSKNNLSSLMASLNNELIEFYISHSDIIFNKGLNPDTMIEDVNLYTKLFDSIYKPSLNIEEREKVVINILNDFIPHNITRVSINHPAAILATSSIYALYHEISDFEIIKASLKEGGSASALAFCTSLFLTITNMDFDLSQSVLNHLINKNKIETLCHKIENNKFNHDDIKDFISTEKSLTSKEIEEKTSKNKHNKQSQKSTKKPKSKSSKEEELNRHVVESWTKVDKAKWRKKREKFSEDDADNN